VSTLMIKISLSLSLNCSAVQLDSCGSEDSRHPEH